MHIIRVKEGKNRHSETYYVVSVCCWSEKVKGNPLGGTPKTETSSGPLLPSDKALHQSVSSSSLTSEKDSLSSLLDIYKMNMCVRKTPRNLMQNVKLMNSIS